MPAPDARRRHACRPAGPRARLSPLAPFPRGALAGRQWRKLSGPASSGERALGLTVPLFAAVASFYSPGRLPLAPRLMLLDEAFAGIDDAARAHCMGLIRDFDLDFVITSEREWALLRGAARRRHLPVAAARGHRRGLRLALDLGRPRQDARARSRSQVCAAMSEAEAESDARLNRLLGGEALAALRRRLRRHFERADA